MELGSFTKAADDLRIAQSALSYQVLRLEDELRVKLLERHSRGVVATDAGLALLAGAYNVMREMDNIRSSVWSHARFPSGEVSVGAPPSVTRTLAPALVARFHANHPDVRLSIREGAPALVNEWLLQGKIDFAVLYGDSVRNPDLHRTALNSDRLHILGSSSLPPLPTDGVDAMALNGVSVVVPSSWYGLRRELEYLVADREIKLKVLAEIDSVAVLKKLVYTGFGYAILPRYAAFDDIEEGKLWATPIENLSSVDYLYLVHLRKRERSSALDQLERLLKEEALDLVSRGWGEAPLGTDTANA